MIFAVAALLAATQPATAPSSGPTFMPSTSPQSTVHSHPMIPSGGPASQGPTKEQLDKSLNQSFDQADTNHDGQLSKAEFVAAGEKSFAQRQKMIAEMIQKRQQLMQTQGHASGAPGMSMPNGAQPH